MTLNEYIMSERSKDSSPYPSPVPKIECVDGFSISVQASSTHYCSPRDNEGPWDTVECGFPSAVPTEIM
jgi:hypothetical protein